ncbi:OCIA domain-containing protein 1-like [Haliotis asinina]|uniref:OCIA domain-containing protein 1-like n=1 Tax=Haliotis asinina TaxID=109174 RepID=UPI0035322863
MSAPNASQQYQEQQPGQRPRVRHALTEEEQQVINECNRESFYYRCLPLSLSLMAGVQLLINRGVLARSPSYGIYPKHIGACVLGFILGKMSYFDQCKKKIIAKIPNSHIGLAARGLLKPEDEMALYQSASPVEGRQLSDIPKDEMRSTDFDTDKTPAQIPKGLDINDRPSVDQEGFPLPAQEKAAPSFKSYDDLRSQNRMDFERKMASSDSPLNQPPWPAPAPPSSQGRQFTPRPSPRQDTSKSKNKYGDEWDE